MAQFCWQICLHVFVSMVFVLSMADLGRFEENFSIGFQLRTLDQTGLIFYLFSRRVEDVFVVQLIDGKVSTTLKSWLSTFSVLH